jgi:hypothetical protein
MSVLRARAVRKGAWYEMLFIDKSFNSPILDDYCLIVFVNSVKYRVILKVIFINEINYH